MCEQSAGGAAGDRDRAGGALVGGTLAGAWGAGLLVGDGGAFDVAVVVEGVHEVAVAGVGLGVGLSWLEEDDVGEVGDFGEGAIDVKKGYSLGGDGPSRALEDERGVVAGELV